MTNDGKGLNIVIDDEKAVFLMAKVLGYADTINTLAVEMGLTKIQLQTTLEKLYPTLNIDRDWVIDLRHTQLRRLSTPEKKVKEAQAI